MGPLRTRTRVTFCDRHVCWHGEKSMVDVLSTSFLCSWFFLDVRDQSDEFSFSSSPFRYDLLYITMCGFNTCEKSHDQKQAGLMFCFFN